MFASEKAFIELTKTHAPGHLLPTYQLSAVVLQVTLAARERREAGHSKNNAIDRGLDTKHGSDGAEDPYPHSWGGMSCSGIITPTTKTASLPSSTDQTHGLLHTNIQVIHEV